MRASGASILTRLPRILPGPVNDVRLDLRAETVVEWLALRLGLVPVPAAQAWGGMGLSAVVITATRLGLFERLATGPASTVDLAAELELDPTVAQLLLDCLVATGQVIGPAGGPYGLSPQARRWLDPASRRSVASFVAASHDYWGWWAELETVARTGAPAGQHDREAADPYWRRYLLGQRDLARLSAAQIARRLRLPRGASRLLDLGGGHGLNSIELCRRHPRLTATILDLPGSAAIGAELVAAAGLADRISFVTGDARTAELGGPYDTVLCFNLVHHLRPAEVPELFGRLRTALTPHGRLAVMDAFAVPGQRGTAAASMLNLFTFLSSGVAGYTPAQLAEWLATAGFGAPKRLPIRAIPGQALYLARRRSR